MIARTWREALHAANPDFLSMSFRFPLHVRGKGPLRSVVRRLNAAPTSVVDGVSTRRAIACSDTKVPLIVHEPTHERPRAGALVWYFGGGLISGSAEHANTIASTFAKNNNVIVVACDYRLAPEHPYPAAIDDCFTALEWTVDHAEKRGIPAACIAVGGDSAGAGLAAAVAQRAHDTNISLCLQLLIHPMLDDRTVMRATTNREVYLAWTVPSNRYGWTSYLGHTLGQPEVRPYAVPARRKNLEGLAPTWISVGSVDQFHDECVVYANRLEQAGVPCELHVIPGAHHGAEALRPDHPLIATVREARHAALDRALSAAT